jgi:acyl-CoA synthetase (AMP-forming)/AMP-acid ligase II
VVPTLTGPNSQVSGPELTAAVDAFAERLRVAGARPGRTVAWLMHDRIETLLLELAARRLGVVVAP